MNQREALGALTVNLKETLRPHVASGHAVHVQNTDCSQLVVG